MQIDPKVYESWLIELEVSLPKIRNILANTSTRVLVIGAAVLEFYAKHEWIPPLSRRTGDLDLSVGIVTPSAEEYSALKNSFLKSGYTEHARMHYRFLSPKSIPGTQMGYVDLLAYPASSSVSDGAARNAMQVGENFSLAGFEFANLETLKAAHNVEFPNPFGLLLLKADAYKDEPNARKKDFGDIIELLIGLVSKGTHYDLESTWKTLKTHPESARVLSVLNDLQNDTSSLWDIDSLQQELLSRSLWAKDIAVRVQRSAKEILELLNKA